MRQLEYDLRLAKTIKTLREGKHYKQICIANALNLTQATYSKIEKGEISITPGQLKIIANELEISSIKILQIVESKFLNDSEIIHNLEINYELKRIIEILNRNNLS